MRHLRNAQFGLPHAHLCGARLLADGGEPCWHGVCACVRVCVCTCARVRARMSALLPHADLYRRATGRTGGVRGRAAEFVRALVHESPSTDASVGFDLSRQYETALFACQQRRRNRNWATEGASTTGIFNFAMAQTPRPASAPPLIAPQGEALDPDDDDVDSYGVPIARATSLDAMQPSKWQCKGCGCTDPEELVPSTQSDAGDVCNRCGTVASWQNTVACHRQKNCEEEEDKTQVADNPFRNRAADDRPLHYDGIETAEEARKRRARAARATNVGLVKRPRSGGASAGTDSEAAVQAQALKDQCDYNRSLQSSQARGLASAVRERSGSGSRCGSATSAASSAGPVPNSPSPLGPNGSGNPNALENKVRNIAIAVEWLFRLHIPGSDGRLQREVRCSIEPLLKRAEALDTGAPKCRTRLNDKSNNLLALVIAQRVLMRIASECAESKQLPREYEGCSYQHLQQQIAALSQVTDGGSGATQVLAATVAVATLLNPSLAPPPLAVDGAPSPSPLLLLPAPVPLARGGSLDSLGSALDHASLSSPSSSSPSASASSASTPWSAPGTPPPPPLLGPTLLAIRDAIAHATKLAHVPTHVHAGALQALGMPKLAAHLASTDPDATLPPDVLAVLLLRAVAASREHDARGVDSNLRQCVLDLNGLLSSVCKKLSIARHTADATSALLSRLILEQDACVRIRPPSRLSSACPPTTPSVGEDEDDLAEPEDGAEAADALELGALEHEDDDGEVDYADEEAEDAEDALF